MTQGFYKIQLPDPAPDGVEGEAPRHPKIPPPDLDIIGWVYQTNSDILVMRTLASKQGKGRDGQWNAMVCHPTSGVEKWVERNSRAQLGTPIRVVLLEKYTEDMAELRARVEALESTVLQLLEKIK